MYVIKITNKKVKHIYTEYLINLLIIIIISTFRQTVMREWLAVTDPVENKLSMPHQLLWSDAALLYLNILDL